MPKVFAAAKVIIAIVIAAPSILIVAPSGIETEYMSSSRFNFLQSSKFTGMFAAELRVKNAVIPLSFKHLKTRGYGFILNVIATIAGETISAIKSIAPTKTRIKVP